MEKNKKKIETNKKKNVLLSIGIILGGLLLAGGTYAFLVIAFNITNGNYVYNSVCFDIGYSITNDDGTMDIAGTLEPSSKPVGGLSGTVSLGINPDCNVSALGNFYFYVEATSKDTNILTQLVDAHCENPHTLESLTSYNSQSDCTNNGGIWVTEGSALKYAIYQEGVTMPVSVGYVDDYNTDIVIYNDFDVSSSVNSETGIWAPIDYKVFIWLDGNLIDNSYASIPVSGYIYADVTQTEDGSKPEAPVLDDGMIPVTIANDGTVKTVSENDPSWYNYESKEWANVILVNSDSRNAGRYSTVGVKVDSADILAYYVWIPRYKYKIWTTGVSNTGEEQSIEIVFENKNDIMSNGTLVDSYKTHPAFWWDDNNNSVVDSGETLAGIWVGKFETTGDDTTPTILPNQYQYSLSSVSDAFVTSQKFSKVDNQYGLNNITTDSHLMKNSEWAAVLYLSHSIYGINSRIEENNYFTEDIRMHITSCGYDSSSGSDYYASVCVNSYGNSMIYQQSTTGNISGVFDMSGGAWEYVMGHYGVDIILDGYTESGDTVISGFSEKPERKYYDAYEFSDINSCTIGSCGGHALSETFGWYDNSSVFLSESSQWLMRGGDGYGSAYDGDTSGFEFSSGYGYLESSSATYRSTVIIK